MVKSDDRRAALLELLADHLLAEGVGASSLRPLAKAAGLSDRMLLYYFKDKAEVMEAALGVIAARFTILLGERTATTPLPLEPLIASLSTILLDDELWPYMRLWLEIASLAARGDPIFRQLGEAIARGFLAWGGAQLDSPPAQHARDTARLLATIEGMVLLKSFGLEDVARQAV